jgi:uncharacterized repeat protein (TIGR03833 family)
MINISKSKKPKKISKSKKPKNISKSKKPKKISKPKKPKKISKSKKHVPKVGNKVEIAIKPYKGKTKIGIIKRVLTKKKYHSRGHKVMLNSDNVGRIISIL